jgi:hypothetical protein
LSMKGSAFLASMKDSVVYDLAYSRHLVVKVFFSN